MWKLLRDTSTNRTYTDWLGFREYSNCNVTKLVKPLHHCRNSSSRPHAQTLILLPTEILAARRAQLLTPLWIAIPRQTHPSIHTHKTHRAELANKIRYSCAENVNSGSKPTHQTTYRLRTLQADRQATGTASARNHVFGIGLIARPARTHPRPACQPSRPEWLIGLNRIEPDSLEYRRPSLLTCQLARIDIEAKWYGR